MVFASGSHLVAPEALLEGVHGALAPRALVGCGAGGVLGGGRELESGTAVGGLGGGFRRRGRGERLPRDGRRATESDAWLDGLPELDGTSGAILLVRSVLVPR